MSKDIVFLGILAASLVAWTFVTAEFAADVKRFERWLTRKVMPASGTHSDPRETGPLNVLPDDTPPDWTTLLAGSVDDVRRRHGRHALTQPRQPLAEQVIDVAEAPGHAPWSGSFPALQDPDADARADDEMADEIRRVKFARSLLEQHDPADITPELLQDVMASLRAIPVYGEAPQLAVDEAQALAERTIA